MRLEDTINETAKGRSLRVPLDHYERPDKIVAAKWTFSAIAAGAALFFILWLFFGGRTANWQVSPAPVAAVHAGFNSDCTKCHVDFRPLRSDAVHLFSLTSSKSQIREVVDKKCIDCHNEPEHHHSAKPDEVPNCAGCHLDHRGRAADIIRPPDSACLSCHRDIQSHRDDQRGPSWAVKNVTGFRKGPENGEGPHPRFRSLDNDPGNIKFNHWLHLQPGLAVKDAKSKNKKKLSDLDETKQTTYKKYAKDEGLLQLDCTACHEPDSEGRYMRPIAFEQHCQACHPLQVRLAEVSSPLEIPHGLSAEKLKIAVDGLVGAAKSEQPSATQSDERSRELHIPGRTLGQNLAQKIGGGLPGRISIAERTIAAKCAQCHYERTDRTNTTELLDALEANIPQTWFKQARFDHNAHQRFDCSECHQQAYAYKQHDKEQLLAATAGATIARDNEIVMISGLNESCVRCHAPRGEFGGARFDCAECHQYHDRDKIVPAVPSAPPRLTSADLGPAHFVSFLDTPSYIGSASCASSGCHGEVKLTAPPWNGAFTTWVALGPHVQAYDVLWEERGREMTRLLVASEGKVPDKKLSDADHFRALQEKCVGCHATPRRADAPEARESYAIGVQCESCHGAAGTWLHTHYREGFTRGSATGLFDNEDLKVRAETCMRCHVGPNKDAGNTQVVDHDLIAAGHPRLAFEFHAYLSNLPPHWLPQDDVQRYPGEYHFRSWAEGQKRLAEQRPKLQESKEWVDFAQLDCFACHHQLAANSPRQPANYDDLQPPQWPPASLQPKLGSEMDLPGRLRFAGGLLEESQGRWDAVLQSYLATRAILRDVRRDASPQVGQELTNVDSAVARLGAFLAKDCFPPASDGSSRPTQYDSPTLFTPEAAAKNIRPVAEALKRLETAIGRP